jgi:gas vesicle protein
MSRENNSGFSSGMLGLIFGFVAGAVAVILSDPDNRDKVKSKSTEFASKARESVSTLADSIKEGSQKVNDAVQHKVTEIDDAVTKEIDKTKEEV